MGRSRQGLRSGQSWAHFWQGGRGGCPERAALRHEAPGVTNNASKAASGQAVESRWPSHQGEHKRPCPAACAGPMCLRAQTPESKGSRAQETTHPCLLADHMCPELGPSCWGRRRWWPCRSRTRAPGAETVCGPGQSRQMKRKLVRGRAASPVETGVHCPEHGSHRDTPLHSDSTCGDGAHSTGLHGWCALAFPWSLGAAVHTGSSALLPGLKQRERDHPGGWAGLASDGTAAFPAHVGSTVAV